MERGGDNISIIYQIIKRMLLPTLYLHGNGILICSSGYMCGTELILSTPFRFNYILNTSGNGLFPVGHLVSLCKYYFATVYVKLHVL